MSLAPPGSKAGRLHIGKIKLERFLRPDLMTSLGGTELLDRSSSVVMVAIPGRPEMRMLSALDLSHKQYLPKSVLSPAARKGE